MSSRLILAALLLGVLGISQAAIATTDEYIEGYAAAILMDELQLPASAVTVRQGVVIVDLTGVIGERRERVTDRLSSIEGVSRVDILEDGKGREVVSVEAKTPAVIPFFRRSVDAPTRYPSGRRRVFEPLLADPRWPHFSVSYHYYLQDTDLENVGSATLGETYAFWRSEATSAGQFEFGPQAAVFAIFDFDAPSTDLINADYFVSMYASYRLGAFSAIGRIYHQSSHLGDEYLLRNPVERVNISYEAVDLILSYDFSNEFRLYAGGGALIHKEPEDLESWSVQYGLQLTSPITFFNETIRPIAAVDFHNREGNDYRLETSARAGVQIESPHTDDLIQILIEYFDGNSPNGQFYESHVEYIGIGLHIYF